MLPEELRNLPYLVHTNRELGLMLRGVKPLSSFGSVPGADPDCIVRYLRMFDRHVELGRFVKRVQTTIISAPKSPYTHIDHIYYALPGEEWRVDAMLELLRRPGGWSDDREREFGSLLGYGDWQNDFWLSLYPHRPEP